MVFTCSFIRPYSLTMLGTTAQLYSIVGRARFPSEDVEPAVLQSAKKEKSGRLSSLSKLKSAIRM